MRKLIKKSSIPMDTSKITTAEKYALIKDIYEVCVSLDYCTPQIFSRVVRHTLKAFLIGKKEKPDPLMVESIISKLINCARRTSLQKPEIRWFSQYASKVNRAEDEAQPSGEAIFQDIAKIIFPKLCIELDGFGHLLSTSDQGEEVMISSLSGFLHMFNGPDALRSHALNLLSAADEVERARTTIAPTGIPEGYEETALEEWEEQRQANAWLMPPKDTDQG